MRHKKFLKIQFKFYQYWNYTPFWCSQLPNFTTFRCPWQLNFTSFWCPRQPNFISFRGPQQAKGSPPPTEEHPDSLHKSKGTTLLYIVLCTICTLNCTLFLAFFFFRKLLPNFPTKLFHQIVPLNWSTQSFYLIFPPNFSPKCSANFLQLILPPIFFYQFFH